MLLFLANICEEMKMIRIDQSLYLYEDASIVCMTRLH